MRRIVLTAFISFILCSGVTSNHGNNYEYEEEEDHPGYEAKIQDIFHRLEDHLKHYVDDQEGGNAPWENPEHYDGDEDSFHDDYHHHDDHYDTHHVPDHNPHASHPAEHDPHRAHHPEHQEVHPIQQDPRHHAGHPSALNDPRQQDSRQHDPRDQHPAEHDSRQHDPRQHDSRQQHPAQHDPREDNPQHDPQYDRYDQYYGIRQPDDGRQPQHDPREHDTRQHDPREHDPGHHDPREHDSRQHDPREHDSRQHDPREHDSRQQHPAQHDPREDNPQHDPQYDRYDQYYGIRQPDDGRQPQHDPREHDTRQHDPREHDPGHHDPREHDSRQHDPREHHSRQHDPREHDSRQQHPAQHDPREDNPQHDPQYDRYDQYYGIRQPDDGRQPQHDPREHDTRQHDPREHDPRQHDPRAHDHMQQDPREHDPRQHDPRTHDPREHDPRQHDPREHDPRQHDPREHDPRQHDPREQDTREHDHRQHDQREHDPRQHDPRQHDPREQDPRHQDARNQDPRYQDPRYQDPRQEDPREHTPHHDPQYDRYDQYNRNRQPDDGRHTQDPRDHQESPRPHEGRYNEPYRGNQPLQPDPRQTDPHNDPRQHTPYVDVRYDPRQPDPRQEDPRQQDPRQQDPRQQDPRQQDPRQQDPRQQDPRQQDPRYNEPYRGDHVTQVDPRQHEHHQPDPREDPRYGDPYRGQQSPPPDDRQSPSSSHPQQQPSQYDPYADITDTTWHNLLFHPTDPHAHHNHPSAPQPDPRTTDPRYQDPREDPRQGHTHYPSQQPSGQIIVNIPRLGQVAGEQVYSNWTQRPINKFLDIKYAESPSGQFRFKAPQPVRPWSGIRDATRHQKACPSFPDLDEVIRNERQGDVEDCLTLSVYTPSTSGNFPVMLYIHGDFFFDGNSREAQPHYLLEKDVVLVSVQYRLAPIGFLSTMTDDIPGNLAVLDVIAGLEWVQKNIRSFGGNPQSVTVFGQGAGASLAHLLTISPVVPKGLFHRIILQSGSIYNPFFLTTDPVKHALDIARRAHCDTSGSIRMVNQCLLQLKTSDLVRAFMEHGQENELRGVGNYGGFQFTIGDPLGILPAHPSALLRQGKGQYYPTMGGVTRNVGSFIYKKIMERNVMSFLTHSHDVESLVELIVKQTVGPDDAGIWKSTTIRDLFTPEQIRESSIESLSPGLIDLCSNILYKGPVLQALQMNAEHLPHQTYLYTFDFEGRHNRYNVDKTQLPFDFGISFTDENIYLFPFPESVANLQGHEARVARIMVDLWTSFATTGTPRTANVEWLPLTHVTGPYMRISESPAANDDFNIEFTITGLESVIKDVIDPHHHFH